MGSLSARVMLPVLGPKTAELPRPYYSPKRSSQAYAVWQWWNYIETQVPVTKTLLRVNLDETSVCLFQGGRAGAIFCTKKRARPQPCESVSLQKRRTFMSHVALICDNAALQPAMPQFVLANNKTLSAGQLAAMTHACPSNVTILRQKSAWNNRFVSARIVRALRAALEPHMADVQPVLLMDTAKLHYAKGVLAACRRACIWVVMIPPKMTWLLQPLDTHAFYRFKVQLQRAYLRVRASKADGQATIEDFMPCLWEAIRVVLQGVVWSRAFLGDGFGQRQRQLSTRVLDHLQMDGASEIAKTRPTLDQLRVCFPKRASVPSKSLWGPFDEPVAGAAGAAVAAVAPASPFAGALVAGRGRGAATPPRTGRGGRVGEDGCGRTRSGLCFRPA
jgi:hypothetical protein